MSAAVELRPYQRQALEAISTAAAAGDRRLLAVMATGLGKTVTFAELCRGERAIVLVHRDELVSQTVEQLRRVLGGVDIGVVKARLNGVGAQVVVASVQTVQRDERLEQLVEAGPWDLVIVDEAHHVAAGNSWERILVGLEAGEADGPLLVGWTATPERHDGESLSTFRRVVCSFDLRWGIASRWLCDVRARQFQLAGFDLRNVKISRGDYAAGAAGRELVRSGSLAQVVAGWRGEAMGRPTIVFVPTVQVAHDLAEAFRSTGVAAEAVDAGTPIDERRAIIGRYASGETQIVTNCGVLTEGFDAPSTSCIVLARPTRSRGLFVQMIGRGTRPHPDKDELLVLDFVGAADLDVVQIPDLFGVSSSRLAATVADGRSTIGEAVARQIELDEAEGAATVIDAELLRSRARSTSIAWLRPPAEPGVPVAYIRPLVGDAAWLLVSDGERWAAVDCPGGNERMRVVCDDADLETAQGMAEAAIRASEAATLALAGARWRKQPATAKQRAALSRAGVNAAGMNRGDCADALSVAYAGRKIRAARSMVAGR